MSKAGAQRILERFDKAHPFLVKNEKIPPEIETEIEQTTKLDKFADELKHFLDANKLPTRLFTEPNAWSKFIQLYGNIIDECELVLKSVHLKHINRVVLRLDDAPEILKTKFGNQVLFRIRWVCHGKDGGRSEHFVIFGYDPGTEPKTGHISVA
jgi:hypothetical protein